MGGRVAAKYALPVPSVCTNKKAARLLLTYNAAAPLALTNEA